MASHPSSATAAKYQTGVHRSQINGVTSNGGPVPGTKALFGKPITFFFSGNVDLTDTYTPFNSDRPDNDYLGIGVDLPERNENEFYGSLKLAYQLTDNKKLTLTANCTLTFSNPPASGTAGSFTLILVQDGTGSRTVTWPAAVDWASATAPTLSTGAGDVDILTFLTLDAGTTWYGFVAGQDMS